MSSAIPYLLLGLVLAVVLTLATWLRYDRATRSPLRSVDEFRSTLRAIAPDSPSRRRTA